VNLLVIGVWRALPTKNLIFACMVMLSFLPAGFGERIDPSLIPPDVTLSTGPTPPASPVAAPGVSGSSAANSTATTGGANNASVDAHMPGQPLPPGAIPTPPAPPVGSGSFARPAVNAPNNYSMFQTQPASGPSAAPDVSHDPIAVIETSKGTIKIRLFQSLAPKTVANFVELTQKGFYNGLTFHRVEPGFCIQGGDPLGNGFGMYTDPATHQPRFLALEVASALKHNAPGVVAMAHGQSPNSASSQFYITLSPQPSLDGKYAIFGGVIAGMNVVNSIVKGDKMTTVSVQLPQ
jgi:cyclophilin family peptidyl-prolyl cis-trans isomerase